MPVAASMAEVPRVEIVETRVPVAVRATSGRAHRCQIALSSPAEAAVPVVTREQQVALEETRWLSPEARVRAAEEREVVRTA